MRKRRSAATFTLALAGLSLITSRFLLMGVATAQEAPGDPFSSTFDEGPTPAELARPERADYWAARAARAAKRAETRGEPIPPALAALLARPEPEPAAVDTPVAAAGEGEAGSEGGGGGLPSDEQLARLRQCESGGDYAIDTGNGYYGAYQFSAEAWWSLGYSGYANEAAPEVQDEAVRRLYARSGWYPWPGCASSFGWI